MPLLFVLIVTVLHLHIFDNIPQVWLGGDHYKWRVIIFPDFPVYFNGTETEELSWDNESTVETVCLHERFQV